MEQSCFRPGKKEGTFTEARLSDMIVTTLLNAYVLVCTHRMGISASSSGSTRERFVCQLLHVWSMCIGHSLVANSLWRTSYFLLLAIPCSTLSSSLSTVAKAVLGAMFFVSPPHPLLRTPIIMSTLFAVKRSVDVLNVPRTKRRKKGKQEFADAKAKAFREQHATKSFRGV